MDIFSNPRFCESVLGIAQAYGSLRFWAENLVLGANPDATWRALLVIGALKDTRFAEPVRRLLVSPDSRVRAWACFALGQMRDEIALEQIHAMNADPSNRVRLHAWQAIKALVGPEESARLFPIRIPTSESLVLVSEDSEKMRTTLSNLYQEMGFRVSAAASEQETIELARRLKPQAIITDNQKGKDNLSGLNMTWDLCRSPELRETVIFMLSADSIEPIFLWHGGDCFLSKMETTLEDLGRLVIEYLHH